VCVIIKDVKTETAAPALFAFCEERARAFVIRECDYRERDYTEIPLNYIIAYGEPKKELFAATVHIHI
jgi:hypothetical protein